MTKTQTTGQHLTATLRRYNHIGPRTRQHRKDPLGCGIQNVAADLIDQIRYAATLPGYFTETTQAALKVGYTAVNSWIKHVEGVRINSVQAAYLKSLSPWQFTAFLGEMVDAGIATVGEAERWFRARQDGDIAAWNAKVAA